MVAPNLSFMKVIIYGSQYPAERGYALRSTVALAAQDLASSDFNIFPRLNRYLKGQKFEGTATQISYLLPSRTCTLHRDLERLVNLLRTSSPKTYNEWNERRMLGACSDVLAKSQARLCHVNLVCIVVRSCSDRVA
ncbi:hypothetical protein EVAR_61267_1 [Eumeta japonica]|uniref:Uncharacterized protein n=1 Tax=Eumeta variegata TaxID=151549 RepID=A0A4C1Z8X5_EUMVA|nr:hypothetical protein EVAR_61267_1 [Eumeta japonica]